MAARAPSPPELAAPSEDEAAASGMPADSGYASGAPQPRQAYPGAPLWLARLWPLRPGPMRQRLLPAAALLGCLLLLLLARSLAGTPALDVRLGIRADGALELRGGPAAALQAQSGRQVLAVSLPGTAAAPLALDASILHRAPRWQLLEHDRQAQLEQQRALTALLAKAVAAGRAPATVWLHLGARAPGADIAASAEGSKSDHETVAVPVQPRGLSGLGLLFLPLAATAMLLYLHAIATVAGRRGGTSGQAALLYAAMALAQAVQLLLIASETLPGLGLGPAALSPALLLLRVALDLVTGAAAVHAFALHPHPLPQAQRIAVAAWGGAAAALAAALLWQPLAWMQLACAALGAAALATITASHRRVPDPWSLVVRRMALAALATLLLAALAMALAALNEGRDGPVVATAASVAWYLFFASLLLLPPLLARGRHLLREFALLAGVATVATSLDLVFVAAFGLAGGASLLLALGLALLLYAVARPWLLQPARGGQGIERAFELLYRAAREVRAQPARYPMALQRLLRELFEPLELTRVQRVPPRARVLGDGSALVVPLREPMAQGSESAVERGGEREPAGDGARSALVLRYAHRGLRLFTQEDARLAERVAEQLRRAVAYDLAVERGRSEERTRIAQDLHDDIGARLLTLMYRSPSREMEDYIRHTLQDLKTLTRGLAAAEHRLSHAAAEWKADLTQRLAAAHAELAWHCEYDHDRLLSVVQWSALTRVLRELCSNAMFHGHASRVEVSLRLAGAHLSLSVADDGDGRAPALWSHGLGLGGVRKRVKLLGGEVAWRERDAGPDGAGRGIVCEVVVPAFLPQGG